MLARRLAEIVVKHPTHTALVYDKTRITYQDLAHQVAGFSRGLKSIGIGQPDCVAVILPNCPEFVISFYAIAHLNAIVLPLNPLFNAEEIKYYLQDSQVKAVITHSKWAESCATILQQLQQDTALPETALIVVDQAHPAGIYYQDLVQDRVQDRVNSIPELEFDSFAASSSGELDVLYQYSSGSTGRPKRVSRTQNNLIQEAANFTATTQIIPDDRILCLVPLFHAHGLGNCLLAATYTGATLVLLEPVTKRGMPVEVPFVFRRPRVLDLIQQEAATLLPGVPYIFSTLAETPLETSVDLSSLRLCFSAGNFLPKDVFDQFLQRFGIRVRQLYGCTEAGSVAINLEPDQSLAYNSVGSPLKQVEIRIVNEQGEELPANAVGEVVIRSPALTRGYYNQPELNREAFREGCFFTGDLGKKDENGQLYITGRKKIFIDTGGRKVDPIEIEDILVTHPMVKEAVVVGTQDAASGELIKAVIVAKGECQEQEILAYCRDKLADFKVPRIIDFREEIPKSPLGKVLRKSLV